MHRCRIPPLVIAVAACVATPAAAGTARNKAVVMRSVDALWSAGDLRIADDIYTSDFVCHTLVGPEWRGVDGIKAAIAAHRAAFPDWREHVEDIVAQGDRVVVRLTATGTQRGPFAGIVPTHRAVTVREVSIYRLSHGRIAEQWGMPDVYGMQMQLLSAAARPGAR